MNTVVAIFAVLAVAAATHVKREVVSYVASPVVSYVAPNPVLARASRILGEPGFVSRYVAAPATVETVDARYVAAPQYAPTAQYVAATQYVAAAPTAQYVAAPQYVAAAPATQYVAAAPVQAVANPAKLVTPYTAAQSVVSSSVINSSPSVVAATPVKYSVLV